METKTLRDNLQQGIYKVINPFVRALIRIGLTPNAVTTIGLLLNIGVAIIFIFGAEKTNRGDLSFVGWGGALVLFAGLFDMLDGQVARLGNMSSTFGALYDSVLDRYSELILFLGICYYLVSHHYFLSSLFAFIALMGSMMVSYTRARAEGLGIECKGGIMQRPERVVTIGVCAIACGITGHFIGGDYKVFMPGVSFHIFETMSIFTIPITIMAFMTNITAISRLRGAKKALEQKEKLAGTIPLGKAINFSVVLLTVLFSLANPIAANAQTTPGGDPSPLKFPVPKGIQNKLFYMQRDPNTNTIIYELNVNSSGILDKDNPVKVYWLRYQENGQREDLSYIQKKFAYGLQTKSIGNNEYELRLVSYKKFPLYLRKSELDNKYHVFATVNNKKIQLDRIFVRIEGGSFWIPNVKYVELKGASPTSGLQMLERIKI
ncbi:MAG: CDP-alcohol phosphatidyltransferase [Pedobacter sp.]|jgi:phosphatidylglycerophosphate synthase|nr:CDP-alcohol phosphatidyltransferase [Pedobacter sp.]